MPGSAKRPLVISVYAGLILSTLLVYWQVHDFGFVNFDDELYASGNPHVQNGLTADGILWAFTTGCAANWHPVTWLSLMLDCQLFGTNPGWMHLVNVIFHLANTLLLFAVLRKMTGSLWRSAFVAAAFALHPMHVESVAWIAERKDVLSAFFLLLTMAAYAGYARRPSVFRYLTALALFAIGLMAKPMLVTLPFLLLLLDYWPLGRLDPPLRKRDGYAALFSLVIEKIPFFLLAAASSVITFLVQRAVGTVADIATLPLRSRLANVLLSYVRYIGKMFWPRDLAVFYPFHPGGVPFWQVASCAVLLLVISVLMIRFGRSRKYLLVGWLWFLGALVPVIGLVQVGEQALADRYTYIPYIGLFVMIAWGLPELLSKWQYGKSAIGLSMVIVLVALGMCAYRQVSYWNDSITLFSHAIEVTQDNHVAYQKLGAAYSALDRYDEAAGQYRVAMRLKPDWSAPRNNLAWLIATTPRIKDRDTKEAVRLATRACELSNYENPVVLDTLAAAYASDGRFTEAVDAAGKALSLVDPAKHPQLTEMIRYHLSLYTQGKPYVKPPTTSTPDHNKPLRN